MSSAKEDDRVGRIGALPASLCPPTTARRERSEILQCVLSRVFRMNGLALGKVKAAAGDDQALAHATHEMHLDARFLRIPESKMSEEFRLKRGPQFTIDPREQILVEGRGNALGIVVGTQKRVAILDEIDTDK